MDGLQKSMLFLLAILASVQAHQGHEQSGHQSPEEVENWTYGVDLRKNVGVDFTWNASDPEYVIMQMSSRTKGYISVGFCPVWHDSMEGCDIVVGWVDDSNGTAHLVDYHSPGNYHPVKDPSQDYILISGKQEDNFLTTIKFRRKWDTGDKDDANLEKDVVQLIWSWNTEDVKGVQMKAHDRNSRGHTKTMISLKSPPATVLRGSQGKSGSSPAGSAARVEVHLFLTAIWIFLIDKFLLR